LYINKKFFHSFLIDNLVGMKTVLVTGSNGLLGQKITASILSGKQFNLVATSKGENRFKSTQGYEYAEMDILDPVNVRAVLGQYKPDAIVHTAALTNVDKCETEKELAYALNVEAVKTLVTICEEYNIQFVHLSTDFIFDGANGPYDELGIPNPLSYYGETKFGAEEIIKSSTCKWAILRTIIVYGIISDASRSNIVLWAKGALENGTPINVVNDQWRMPTLAEDLADACLAVIEKDAHGVFNVSGKDMMSISELVFRVADFWNLDKGLITEISAASLNQAAKRPVRTGFILDKTIKELGYAPRSFEQGLALVDQQLKERDKLID
jgi:dTDP-4-dehydrorhamnose reductase